MLLGVVFLIVVAAASSEKTKTVEFNVKPGGVVHTFSEKIVSIMVALASQRRYQAEESAD